MRKRGVQYFEPSEARLIDMRERLVRLGWSRPVRFRMSVGGVEIVLRHSLNAYTVGLVPIDDDSDTLFVDELFRNAMKNAGKWVTPKRDGDSGWCAVDGTRP